MERFGLINLNKDRETFENKHKAAEMYPKSTKIAVFYLYGTVVCL